jgi:hypothetical protein
MKPGSGELLLGSCRARARGRTLRRRLFVGRFLQFRERASNDLDEVGWQGAAKEDGGHDDGAGGRPLVVLIADSND